MAPVLHVARDSARINSWHTTPNLLAEQWSNPNDTLSVLLLLGSDIVQRAVAQQAGRRITPVAFSFGWVAYAVSALLSAFGDGALMPDTDVANTLVIGAESGHQRISKNWILGRLLRDGDNRIDDEMQNEAMHVSPVASLDEGDKASNSDTQQVDQRAKAWEALRVSIYESSDRPPADHGVPTRDWVWYSGFVVVLLQLLVAMVPCFMYHSWDVLFVTASGNLLALAEGSLPQWRDEKWACPANGGATVTLTKGNGSRHAIVIKGRPGTGLDLEVLAVGTRTSKSKLSTRAATTVLAVFWTALLITVAGLRKHTWYLMCIGLVGSIQNLLAAAVPRHASALGIHLDYIETIRGQRVAGVLKNVEQKHPFVGTSLLPVFFPGGLRAKDEDFEFWREAKESRNLANQYGALV